MFDTTPSSWYHNARSWHEVKKDHPDAVFYNGKFYRSSSLGIKPPVRIRITGEDWTFHLGGIASGGVSPELIAEHDGILVYMELRIVQNEEGHWHLGEEE